MAAIFSIPHIIQHNLLRILFRGCFVASTKILDTLEIALNIAKTRVYMARIQNISIEPKFGRNLKLGGNFFIKDWLGKTIWSHFGVKGTETKVSKQSFFLRIVGILMSILG